MESARSIDEPLPVTGQSNQLGLCEPFITSIFGAGEGHDHRVRSLDEPVPTVVGSNVIYLAEPYLVEYHSNGQPSDIDDPMPTITTRDRAALVQPELVAIDAAIVPEVDEDWWRLLDDDDNLLPPKVFIDERGRKVMLDIRFRMLHPKELAGAMSFPEDYVFTGNREEQVKQIGNAVPVRTAAALIENMLK